MRYRVTWKGRYLFHCFGQGSFDALQEARTIAARTMRDEVVRDLVVVLDPAP